MTYDLLFSISAIQDAGNALAMAMHAVRLAEAFTHVGQAQHPRAVPAPSGSC